MNSLALTLLDSRDAYFPGDRLNCSLSWDLEKEPEDFRVHLLWFTEGKGSPDTGIASEEVLSGPGPRGQREFSFPLPSAPVSFSGQLISLRWAVEAVTGKPDANHHVPFVLSPTGAEIQLGDAAEAADEKIPKGCISIGPNRRL